MLANALQENVDAEEDEGDDDGEPSSKKLKSESAEASGSKVKIWFDREVKISDAIANQKDWQDGLRQTFQTIHAEGLSLMKDRGQLY